MIQSPCYECPDRTTRCRDHCPDWAKYQMRLRKEKENREEFYRTHEYEYDKARKRNIYNLRNQKR